MYKKAKSLRGKFSLVNILFLGSLVLGIGCICWALINIGAQSINSADVYRSPSFSPTTFAVKQVKLKGDVAAQTKSDLPSDILNPDKILYPLYPVEGDNIGSLSIPVLKQKLPIIQGTGAEELKKGVGHFVQSVLPGEKDNCVLSGHRDTVFAKLGKLKIGDQLIVQTSAGTYTYEIKRIRIVDKDDKTVIVPTDHAVLTLSTCYPFHFIGNAPDRYILIADLVIG
jgi:sortase A